MHFSTSTTNFTKREGKGLFTVWKFENFSTTQILHEINFDEFRVSKSAILIISDLISRNFRNKIVRVHTYVHKFPKFPHCVSVYGHLQGSFGI